MKKNDKVLVLQVRLGDGAAQQLCTSAANCASSAACRCNIASLHLRACKCLPAPSALKHHMYITALKLQGIQWAGLQMMLDSCLCCMNATATAVIAGYSLACDGRCLLHQVHWVFGKKTQNTSVALNNATLELLHEAPQAGGCAIGAMLLGSNPLSCTCVCVCVSWSTSGLSPVGCIGAAPPWLQDI
jgi:hypothetical protein